MEEQVTCILSFEKTTLRAAHARFPYCSVQTLAFLALGSQASLQTCGQHEQSVSTVAQAGLGPASILLPQCDV